MYKGGNTEILRCRGDRKGWIVRELEVIDSYAATTTWLVVDAYCIWGDVDQWNCMWGDLDQWDMWKGETENYLALQTFMEYSDIPSAICSNTMAKFHISLRRGKQANFCITFYVLKIILSQIDFSAFHGLSLYSMKGCAPTGDDIILIVYHGLSFAYTPWKKWFYKMYPNLLCPNPLTAH